MRNKKVRHETAPSRARNSGVHPLLDGPLKTHLFLYFAFWIQGVSPARLEKFH
jgi:hypothetical protein